MPSNVESTMNGVVHPIFNETEPKRVREIIRRGEWTGPTRGLAMGYVQANLAILPRAEAFDFLAFCQRNPAACPVLEVTDVGDPETKITTPGADLRTDLPRYRIFRDGELIDEVADIKRYWRDDLVAFLLGCNNTFDALFLANDIPVRKLEAMSGAGAFKTNIPCKPAGKFRGPMVVSLEPMPIDKAIRATQVTSRFPLAHGAPIHFGDPSLIGIQDIQRPDWGTSPPMKPGDIPVFWACGITPQAVALEARVEIMISHTPAHMFITDIRDELLSVI